MKVGRTTEAALGCALLLVGACGSACAKKAPHSDGGGADASTQAATGTAGQAASFATASSEVPIARRAAAAASQVDVRECKTKDEPSGPGRIGITFAPSGEVIAAIVAPPFTNTATGTCVAQKYKKIRMPRFVGEPVRVAGEFVIP